MAWTRGAVMIGWRNSDPGSNRLVARVQTNWFQSAAPRRERSSASANAIGPVTGRWSNCSSSSSSACRSILIASIWPGVRQPAKPVGLSGRKIMPRLRRGDDLLRPAVRARLPGADEVDLVGVQRGFGVDPNFGVV